MTEQLVYNFNNLNLADNLLAILNKLKFTTPTPIQHQCIPEVLAGKDLVGIAQTGTGKTMAYGIPLIQQLLKSNGQALIMVPTRELALQVDEVLQKLGRSLGINTVVIIGGASSRDQIRKLREHPHVVVSTPGRLVDHLQQGNFTLGRMAWVVLDEADRMLDIGFLPQIKQILTALPKDRQTLLFSATMPPAIADIAARFMRVPLRIEVAPAGTAAANVTQEIFIVGWSDKLRLLERVLADNDGSVLVFSRTKHGARKLVKNIKEMGDSAIDIHSNRSLSQRRAALEGFKSGKYRVLVATDIASRGIDVSDIALVINFDLPDNLEDYVHRIGRTGRADSFGKAVSFATPEQRSDIRHIEKLIRKTIPILALPELPPHRQRSESDRSGGGRQFSGRSASGGRRERSGFSQKKAYGSTREAEDRPPQRRLPGASSSFGARNDGGYGPKKSFGSKFSNKEGNQDRKSVGGERRNAYGSQRREGNKPSYGAQKNFRRPGGRSRFPGRSSNSR